MRQLEVLELRIDHSLRRAPGAAERAACLDAAGELVEELLEVRCVKRPHELVRRRAEAAVHARARRAEARRRIGLKHMTAGDPGAALGGERQLEQGTVRDRPADIDARLGGKPPLRLDRAAERAGGIVAEGGGIEVRELEIRLEGERIGEAQPAGAGELAALRGGAQPSHVHRIAAAHGVGAHRHASLLERATHALLVTPEIELEGPRERGLAQRGAQRAQVERFRAHRAAKALRPELAAAFQQPAAGELDAQLFQHRAREVLACNARPQGGERQLVLIDRSRGRVGELHAALQAAVATSHSQMER